MRRLELNILYWFTRVVLLFAVPVYISDLHGYEGYARNLFPQGKVPYLDWDFEYPPLAYIFISLPVWLHDLLGLRQTESTRFLFGLLLLPFDLLTFRAFLKRPRFSGSAFAYILLSSCMGLLIFDRFDLLLGFLIAWPFLSHEKATDLRYAFFWGLGAALKLVPLSLAPLPALAWEGRLREKIRRFFLFSLPIFLPVIFSCVLAAALSHGRISFLSHHSQRGVQIESLVGSIVMFLQSFFQIFSVRVDSNFGAQHLSELSGAVLASRVLFYGMMLVTYFGLFIHRMRYSLLASSWLVMLTFVAFGYVLSPQFLLWLIPLGLCVVGELENRHRQTSWLALFSLTVVLTGLHFRFYWNYVNFHYSAVVMVLGRNLALAALWWLSWVWLRRDQWSPKTGTPAETGS